MNDQQRLKEWFDSLYSEAEDRPPSTMGSRRENRRQRQARLRELRSLPLVVCSLRPPRFSLKREQRITVGGMRSFSDLVLGSGMSDLELVGAADILGLEHFKPVLYGQVRLRAVPPRCWLAFGSVGLLGIRVVIPADLNEEDTFRRLAEIIADTSPTYGDIAVL